LCATRLTKQQPTGDLTLHNLTLTNGKNTGHAGAILVEGTLSLVDSFVISNTADSSGGAIYNRGGSVTLVSSRFEHNQADFGGALAGTISGTITLSDTTLYSNTAEESGGGVNNTEGGTLNLSDSVITANRALFGAGINNSRATCRGRW
jgi:hypothetical protein